MSTVRLGAVLLAAALLVAGCTGGDDQADRPASTDRPTTDPVVDLPSGTQLAAALRPFDSCEQFLDHVQSEALELVGPYGLGGGMATDDIMVGSLETTDTTQAADGGADSAVFDEAGAGRLAGADGEAFSTTNVQEAGVDEPDIVKTDGHRVVAIARGLLHVVDVTGPEPVLVGSTAMGDFWVSELFLVGDRVLAIGHGDVTALPLESRLRPGPDTWRETMRLVSVDISDPSRPAIERTMVLSGGYVSARLVDGVARVVVREWEPALRWSYSEGDDAAAVEANRQVVRDSTVDDWLPGYSILDASGGVVTEGRLVDCDRAHHPDVFGGLGTVSVVTVDVGSGIGDAPVDGVSVLGAGETVYASPTGLYVTTTSWDWMVSTDGAAPAEEVATEVHRFDIGTADATTYVASGEVPGYVLNQWALDEHDGYLRVATTTSPPWGSGASSESMLTVLATSGETMSPVGQVRGLGPGEQIFAVRYFDDLATVVTFEQTDPLYTIDLSDPASPTVLGELKINGYSAYLHPIGPDLLLGVGQDATDEGFTTGTQVSLFDISDLSAPTRVGQWTLPGGSSEVEFDARAFLWWPETELAVIPISVWGDGVVAPEDDAGPPVDEPWFGAVGISVHPDGTITEVGRLTQQGPPRQTEECWMEAVPAAEVDGYVQGFDPSPDSRVEVLGPVPGDESFVNVRICQTWWDHDWDAQIRRTVVIGDRLYTLSEKGLQSAELATLAPLGLVEFPQPPAGAAGAVPIEG